MGFLQRAPSACHGLLGAGFALVLMGTVVHIVGNDDVVAATDPLAGARTAVDRLAETGSWPPEEVRPVLDVLEEETRQLIALPRDQTATRVGEQLLAVLAKLYKGISGRTNAMREEVLERDGDLKELMATRAYRERETLALTALYHLSWARYQMSQLVPANAPTREQLLRSAVDGFTEFVYVNEIPEIYGDCLYGRALAFHALGETRKATEDLQEVLDLGPSNRAYSRARSTLEALRRGKPTEPPAPVDRTTAELDRLKTLLDSQTAPGKERRNEQEEALALARTLASRGGRTADAVNRLARGAAPAGAAFPSFLLAEIASDRGDHAAARDQYGAVAAASDPDAATYRSRARIGVAAASYRAGEYARAAEEFADFLSESPTAEDAELALYFRVKALEALRTKAAKHADGKGEVQAGSEASDALVGALGAYLDRFADGDHAPEVRYRLAEAYHSRSDCTRALDVIGSPRAVDAWSLQARFIALQCRADATRTAWSAGEPDAQASYQASLEAVREITREATRAKDTTLERLGAKTCFVGALLAAAAPTPQPADVVELTGDFEQRFPDAADLAGDAIALRALARTSLGDIDEALQDIDRLSSMEAKSSTQQQSLRHVGHELMREAERGDPARRHAVLSVAQRVYNALTKSAGDGGDGSRRPGTAGGPTPQGADLAILGQVSLDLGDSDSAARAYRRLLEVDPDSLEARRGVALTAEAQGQESDALQHWRRVTERTKPGETLWYEAVLHAARMEERLGQPGRACAALREAKTNAGLPAVGELVSAFAELERRVCR